MNTLLCSRIRTSVLLTVVLSIVTIAAIAAEDSDTVIKEQDVKWDAEGEVTMAVIGNVRTINLAENVVITQGALKILGDRAVMEYDEPTREFTKVTVYGSPVEYQQQLDSGDSMVSGNSDSILLFTEASTGDSVVELIGNAYIKSPDSTMNCAAIIYIPDTDLIRKATGPCTGTLSQTEEP